eukprot:TRINITY_DN1058_c2_g3_i1.p1 TRINITY_DN1058_c2_g3~~TRINITY_DN1058_c2_g3_i1.p1  ORF type:complete len:407 (-),score=60.95 TRINITY_DN1058_c2_g3_i1:854-2074(-)
MGCLSVCIVLVFAACSGGIRGQSKVSQVSDLVDGFIDDIYKFWITYGPDEKFGGFYTQVDEFGVPSPNQPKNIIMMARQLYVAAFLFLNNRYPLQDRSELVQEMHGLFDWIEQYLYDEESNEFFYEVSANGSNVVDSDQRAYYTAFAISGLSYYSTAAKKIGHTERAEKALDLALQAYQSLHERLYDAEFGGYDQSRENNWFSIYSKDFGSDLQKSSKGGDTQMHMLEALTGLYRASQDTFVGEMLAELLDIFVNTLFKNRPYIPTVMTRNWASLTDYNYYGHNIEVAHLIQDAAKLLNYGVVNQSEVDDRTLALARYVQTNGQDKNLGGVYKVGLDGHGVTDFHRNWWTQAEASLGYWRAYQISNDESFLDDLLKNLNFYQGYQSQIGEFFDQYGSGERNPYLFF